MVFVSYAQNFEDILLQRVFRDVQEGFYVDIGAYDPIIGSVTKAFYDRGWRGINFEPGSIYEKLAAARPRDVNLRLAVLDHAGTVPFAEPADLGQAHVGPAAEGEVPSEVTCNTLAAVLAEHAANQPIDFLKIDAEGSEGAIIRSTDWRRIRPKVIVAEATQPWSSELANQEWEPILLRQGYLRAYFDGINCFYIAEEHSALLNLFSVPVCALDNFRQFDPALEDAKARIVQLEEAFALTRKALETAENTARRLQERTTEVSGELARLREELLETTGERNRLRDEYRKQAGILEAVSAERAKNLATLDRLIRELRWDDGPRSIRVVLPLARITRLIAHKGDVISPVAAKSSPGPDAYGTETQTSRTNGGRAMLKRIALHLYRPIRPIVRAVLWRLRTFMTAELRHELAGLRKEIAEAKPAAPDMQPMARVVADETQVLAKEIEQALLTMALLPASKVRAAD